MRAQPFATAADAWFWAWRCLSLRAGGTYDRDRPGGGDRPCDLSDVLAALDGLYKARKVSLLQVRIMRKWADYGFAPSERDRADFAAWSGAMRALEAPLRAKGIIA